MYFTWLKMYLVFEILEKKLPTFFCLPFLKRNLLLWVQSRIFFQQLQIIYFFFLSTNICKYWSLQLQLDQNI